MDHVKDFGTKRRCGCRRVSLPVSSPLSSQTPGCDVLENRFGILFAVVGTRACWDQTAPCCEWRKHNHGKNVHEAYELERHTKVEEKDVENQPGDMFGSMIIHVA